MAASRVNEAMAFGERQVLPRFVDLGRNMAQASVEGPLWVLILDFAHAFMTVPLTATVPTVLLMASTESTECSSERHERGHVCTIH